MSYVKSFASLVAAAFRDFVRREIHSENGEQRPPIRYDGDPRDIYLA